MAAPTYLKVVLILMSLYAGVMGALTLFFQDAGSVLFQYSITDPLTMRYWGGVLLAMSVFYWFLSRDPVEYQAFLWVGVFDLGIAMVLTIINISTKAMNWVQGLPAIMLNPIFMVILLYGLAKEHQGEVVLVSGEESKGTRDSIPEHVREKHPLHGK